MVQRIQDEKLRLEGYTTRAASAAAATALRGQRDEYATAQSNLEARIRHEHDLDMIAMQEQLQAALSSASLDAHARPQARPR